MTFLKAIRPLVFAVLALLAFAPKAPSFAADTPKETDKTQTAKKPAAKAPEKKKPAAKSAEKKADKKPASKSEKPAPKTETRRSAPPVGTGPLGLLSSHDRVSVHEAIEAAKGGKWPLAESRAGTVPDPIAAKIVRWMRLTRSGSGASFAEIAAFLDENPDWPQPNYLQRRAEEAITSATPRAVLLDWFARHPPMSSDGQIALAEALIAEGQTDRGRQILRKVWAQGILGAIQEREFLNRHGDILQHDDHLARLDYLLWEQDFASARRILLKVEPDYRALAQARMALAGNGGGADSALTKLPPNLQNDPGLLFERVRWRRQKGMDEEAVALLKDAGPQPRRADLWWNERAILARRALQRGWVTDAYAVARDHAMKDGASFVEAEWMAGWIALRFLKEPETAIAHFTRLTDAAITPVSKARVAYWLGRAREAAGKNEEARASYAQAAVHVTAYYGQLAADRTGTGTSWNLPADPVPSPQETEAFNTSDLGRAVRLLADAGEGELMQTFLLRVNEIAETPTRRVLAARLAAAVGRTEIALRVARRAERAGSPLIETGYPLPPLALDGKVEKALVLALIRQESGFHQEAQSPAKAQGLMQIIPATAQKLAKDLKMKLSKNQLTQDPDTNLRLGTTYLAGLLDDFSGSYILALAGYNAGPGRARRWIRDMGDPRDMDIDAVDWVEMIPFSETRNYVQRVMEGVQVYRRRLGGAEMALTLERDLKRPRTPGSAPSVTPTLQIP